MIKKLYDAPPVSKEEMLRYARSPHPTKEVEELLESALDEALPHFTYSVVYGDVSEAGEKLKDAFKNGGVVFVASVGAGIDRLVRRYSQADTARALMLQAIGAERIEALCDAFCADMEKEYAERGVRLKKRVSPGYKGYPLELQRDIFKALDCARTIGVSLTDSLLMVPSKSVSAVLEFDI
ncbi:MAG: hypothetical protein IKM09_04020 [Clostridia bacterium]|nr:hypothetical protein [Clostridia bacterium]